MTTLRILAATLALCAACGPAGRMATPNARKRGLPRASRWAEASASAYRAHSRRAARAPHTTPVEQRAVRP